MKNKLVDFAVANIIMLMICVFLVCVTLIVQSLGIDKIDWPILLLCLVIMQGYAFFQSMWDARTSG